MLGAAFLLLVSTPAQAPAAVAPATKSESTSCREMLLSSSRLGTVKVCKTRAGWRRWQSCHGSVTRYCTPKRKMFTAGFADDSRIVCKDYHRTGSRLSQERVCATARDWELAEQETQRALKDRQFGTMLNGGSTQFDKPRGGGPM